MAIRICIVWVASWWLAACGGNRQDAPMAGTGGTDTGVAGGGSLLPAVVPDAGPGSFAPSPVACDGTPAPSPDVERACVLAGSCLPQLGVSVSECISEHLPTSDDAPSCWLGARSCSEVAACFGFSISSTPCPSTDFRSICEGNNVVICDLPRTARDCGAVGGTCRNYSSFPSDAPDHLDAADCSVEATCTGTNDAFVCDGTKRVRCRAGVPFGEDCAARGMACETSPNGAVCVATPPGCAEPGVGSCIDGSKGTFCNSERRVVTIDCAPLGFTCREAPERLHGVRCDAPRCQSADVAQCVESCDGNLAHLCLGGQRHTVDCRAVGLKGCLLEARTGVGDTARCGHE